MKNIDKNKKNFIPKELFQKCSLLVRSTHKDIGYGELPKMIASGKDIVAVTLIPDAFAVLKTTATLFKLRNLCWIIIIILLILSFLLSKWFLLGIIVVFLFERYLSNIDHKSYMFLSSVLLSLEMLVNDFAGWGSAFPKAQRKAMNVLDCDTSNLPTKWLDFYLSRRAELSAELIKKFGPKLD